VYHPTTRVLALLEILQTSGQMSGSELAARLGVDGRTLRRYIARLEDLGIPIAVEHGRHGGYMLVAGYKLPPMMFTDEEALALSVGLLAARGLGLAAMAPGVAGAQAKLERVMPASLRRRVRAADETMALDLPGRPASADGTALAALSAAAQAGHRVRLRYQSAPSAPSEREFDPYGLAYRSGRWYVVGHCHLRKGLRSFRIDRILGVHSTGAAFERPADFDALGHLVFSVATIPRRFAVEVRLKTDLATARRELFATIGVLEAAPEGAVLRGQTDDLDWFARELARLPFDFEIRHPAALREALRVRARALLARAAPSRSAVSRRR
jgi:predicted DNA-binding transcriptional regulator YafY